MSETPQPSTPPARDPRALWEAAPTADAAGEQFLADRGLTGAVERGLVRFNTGTSTDTWLNAQARLGYTIVLPLRDAGGEVRSLQLVASKAITPTEKCLKDIEILGLALGDPLAALSAPKVVFAGDALDTLALALAGFVAVGPAQAKQIGRLATFVGFPQKREMVVCRPSEEDDAVRRGFINLELAIRKNGGLLRRVEISEAYGSAAIQLREVGPDAFWKAIDSVREAPAVRSSPTLSVIEEVRSLSSSYASLCAVLRSPENREVVLWPGELEFNEQTLEATIDRKPIPEHRIWKIQEMAERAFKTDRQEPVKFASADIPRALFQVAYERSFHPVRDYLKALSWDGELRIARILTEILGIPEPLPLQQTIMRRWLISAVARAMSPGCKVDNVLILTGKQGRQKSAFFKTLASPEWFTDKTPDLHNKDAIMVMRRVWILEWGELENMKRASSREATKAFITSQVDMIRPPYGRTVKDFPRTCVIVGTTNEDDFLNDPTGDRRYWPIPVLGIVDDRTLAQWRNQLWAEAVAAYEAGERWYLAANEEGELHEIQQDFKETDVWHERVVGWCEKQWRQDKAAMMAMDGYSVDQVLTGALSLNPDRWTRKEQMRVTSILKAAGWVQGRRIRDRNSNQVRQVRLWSPPPPPQTELLEAPG
jgi:hypothetical protein